MTDPAEPFVVHEGSGLLVVHKPSGLATTAPDDGPCLTRWAEGRCGEKVHPTSRLDADVTGLVTFALTKDANAALLEARRRGRYRRGYLALAAGELSEDEGRWDRSIAIDPKDRRLRIAVASGARGQRVQRARTSYVVRARRPEGTALWLTPHTGRTHQLRVHAADAGAPLLGDQRYGGPRRVVLDDGRVLRAARVMLHCTWLSLPRPAEETLILEAPAPADMQALWRGMGGDAVALRPTPAGPR